MRDPLAAPLRAMLFLAAILALAASSALASPAPAPAAADSIHTKIPSRQVPVLSSSPAASAPDSTALSAAAACAQYSRAANLSAIGTNATIRSAFLEASPVGTLSNAALLNVMQARAAALAADAQLNQACGNLTAVALREVGANFTKGVVGQFVFVGNPVSIINGPLIAVVCVACLVVILGPISAL